MLKETGKKLFQWRFMLIYYFRNCHQLCQILLPHLQKHAYNNFVRSLVVWMFMYFSPGCCRRCSTWYRSSYVDGSVVTKMTPRPDSGRKILHFCINLRKFNWLCKRDGSINQFNTNSSIYGVTVWTSPSICYVHKKKGSGGDLETVFLDGKLNAACSQFGRVDSWCGVDRREGKAPHKSSFDICCYLLLIYFTNLIYHKYFPKTITSYDKAISLSKMNSPDNTILCSFL